MTRLLLLAATLAAAQAVSPTLEGIEGTAQDSQQQRLIRLTAPADATQGFDPGSMTLPTSAGTLRIDIQRPGQPATAPPRRPSPPLDRRPWIALAVMVVTGSWMAGEGVKRLLAKAKPAASAGPSDEWSGQYAIVRTIGAGGMGVVYEAVDRALNRKVAVKKLRDDLGPGADLDAFVREARTVAALKHPNIVEIHSIASQAGTVLLVFEYLEGRPLELVLRDKLKLPPRETLATLRPVCEALEFAHGRGVVHRDLKPANIMIGPRGEVKVMDFGIARQLEAGPAPAGSVSAGAAPLGQTAAARGTLAYMSPESFSGTFSPASDVFALGVMAYLMLSGFEPFSPGDLSARLEGRYRPLSTIMPGLAPAVDWALATALDPDYRKRERSPLRFWSSLATALK